MTEEKTGNFSKWVSELDEVSGDGMATARSNFSTNDDDGFMQRKLQDPGDSHEKRLAGLEQETKLLHWHKLANEAALKAALIRTKRLKEKDTKTRGLNRNVEKAAWMQQVIEEEQGRPLEVNEDFIKNFEKQTRREDERVEQDVQRHISSLQRVKNIMRERDELKRRNHIYKMRKKEINDRIKRKSLKQPISVSPSPSADELLTSTFVTESKIKMETSQASLGNVITSLDKLVELEKRIAQLENDFDYKPSRSNSSLRKRSTSSSIKSGKLRFSKRTVPSSVSKPSSTLYQLKVSRKSKPLNNNTVDRLENQRLQRKQASKTRKKTKGSSTFITSLPQVSTKRAKQRAVQSSALTLSKRRSTQHKKVVGKSTWEVRANKQKQLRGATKQDAVVNDYLRGRSNRRISNRSKRSSSINSVYSKNSAYSNRSRSSSRKPKKVTSAKEHLSKFQEVRRQFDRKKQKRAQLIHARPIKDKVYGRKKVSSLSSTNRKSTRGTSSTREKKMSSTTMTRNKREASLSRRKKPQRLSQRNAKGNTQGLSITGGGMKPKNILPDLSPRNHR